eukprot:TRINITY_DN30319_c0_g1_i1.p1 TRINITY_DN30319_c0_g1~~TRINITY_DN30319_c0_g1_i1.p1  ORF type:complete len:363 (-),score=67.70 TRINITY_DN30319_c0_g1_i1:68-1156(-)
MHCSIDNSCEVVQAIQSLLNDTVTCDVVFLIGKKQSKVMAHRCILASRCRQMKEILYASSTTQEVRIEDELITEMNFRSFLEFVYTGRVTLTCQNVFGCKRLAQTYSLESLNSACDGFFETVKTLDCLAVIEEANQFGFESFVREILCTQTTKVVHSDTFLRLSPNVIVTLLSEDKLQISEIELFLRVQEWAKRNSNVDDEIMNRIFSLIRYGCISNIDLVEKVRSCQYVPKDKYFCALEYTTSPKFMSKFIDFVQITPRDRIQVSSNSSGVDSIFQLQHSESGYVLSSGSGSSDVSSDGYYSDENITTIKVVETSVSAMICGVEQVPGGVGSDVVLDEHRVITNGTLDSLSSSDDSSFSSG